MPSNTTQRRRKLSVDPSAVRALMDRQIRHYEEDSGPPELPTVTAKPTNDEPIDDAQSSPVSEGRATAALRVEAERLDPQRAEALRRVQPKIPLATSRIVRDAVVGQILLVPFKSADSDQTMCSVLYAFADYIYERKGDFCPDQHLTSRLIEHYLADRQRELAPSSLSTHRSTLLRIREGHPDKPRRARIPRKVSAMPYTQDEWLTLRRRVDGLVDQELRTELMKVLDLTGEAGLRTQEAIHATGQWICIVDDVTLLQIPNRHGEFREVPVFGAAGDRLARFRGTSDYLLAPTLSNRDNVMSKVRARAAKHGTAARIGDTVGHAA